MIIHIPFQNSWSVKIYVLTCYKQKRNNIYCSEYGKRVWLILQWHVTNYWTHDAGTQRGSVSSRLAADSSWANALAKSALTISSSNRCPYKNSIRADDLIISANSSSCNKVVSQWMWFELHLSTYRKSSRIVYIKCRSRMDSVSCLFQNFKSRWFNVNNEWSQLWNS